MTIKGLTLNKIQSYHERYNLIRKLPNQKIADVVTVLIIKDKDYWLIKNRADKYIGDYEYELLTKKDVNAHSGQEVIDGLAGKCIVFDVE